MVRIFRYALGGTLALGLALGIDWRMSFLTAVLALSFLGTPAPRPTAKAMASFAGVVAVACSLGVMAAAVFLPYPVVFLLLEGLVLFLLFYHGARGAPPLLIVWLMIALTVIPVVGLISMALAIAVAKGIVVGAVTALAVVWLAHILVPDPAVTGPAALTPRAPPTPPSPRAAAARAWLNVTVVYPVVVVFYVFGLTSVLVLVFVALLSMQPSLEKGFKAGMALIVGNTLGGVAAIVMYELLVMVPQFGFLLVLTLMAALFFGSRLFSDSPKAPLFGMAFSTLVLVIGSTTSSYGDAGSKVWTRVIQITIAVVYLVVAHRLVARLRRKPETKHAIP